MDKLTDLKCKHSDLMVQLEILQADLMRVKQALAEELNRQRQAPIKSSSIKPDDNQVKIEEDA